MGTRLRARRAPFGFPTEGALGPGKSRLPSKVLAIIETAIKKIYHTDVAAVIGGSPASVLQSQDQRNLIRSRSSDCL
jgi:hypothetical protein